MIDQLELENFQSHPHTTLDFHPGINAIVGPSDSGKSAVLRAFRWILNNRPSGESFISFWARDKKGKQTKECKVRAVKKDSGLTRLRSPTFNGYNHNGKDIAAVRTDVPEEVQAFFNLSEVNVQRQLDAPFLLSSTPGEVARFFNKTIKLDEIDQALSLVEKKKRETDRKINTLKEARDRTGEELKKYKDLDQILSDLFRAEKLETKLKECRDAWAQMQLSLEERDGLQIIIKKAEKTTKLSPIIDEITEIIDEIEEKKDGKLQMIVSLDGYEDRTRALRKAETLVIVEPAVDRARKISDKLKTAQTILANCRASLDRGQKIARDLPIIRTRIKELNDELPEVCPTCNGTGKLREE